MWMLTLEGVGLFVMLMTFDAAASCGVGATQLKAELAEVGLEEGLEFAASLCASCAPCSFSRRFRRI